MGNILLDELELLPNFAGEAKEVAQRVALAAHSQYTRDAPAGPSDSAQRVPWQQIEDLAAAVRRQRFCRDLFYRGQAGQTYIATHEATGLVVKVRPDLLIIVPKRGGA